MIVLVLFFSEWKNNDDRLVRGIVVVYVLKGDVVFFCIYFFNIGDGNSYGNYYGELFFLWSYCISFFIKFENMY